MAWTDWEPDIAQRDPAAVARWSARCERDIRLHKLTQFLFFEQWQRVREACRARSIAIMGDIPIFVAHDSADVWARRELFRLDADGRPAVVAGVPPDYFSATGQLWGNPHYRWDALERTGYAWWIERFRALLDTGRPRADRPLPRLRGVLGSAARRHDGRARPMGEGAGRGAVRGGPAALGVGATAVRRREPRRHHAGGRGAARAVRLPGMAILQFAFGTDPQAPDFMPHNYPRNRVVYTGTHDNDTTVGWWTGEVGHSTRSSADI